MVVGAIMPLCGNSRRSVPHVWSATICVHQIITVFDDPARAPMAVPSFGPLSHFSRAKAET